MTTRSRTQRREEDRERYKDCKVKSLCTRCREPLVGSKSAQCPSCRKKTNEEGRVRHKLARIELRCIDCGNPAEPGKCRCASCKEIKNKTNRNWTKRIRDQGEEILKVRSPEIGEILSLGDHHRIWLQCPNCGEPRWTYCRSDGSISIVFPTCSKCRIYKLRLPLGEAAFNTRYDNYRRGSKKSNREFKISKSEFRRLVISQCYYCGSDPSNVARTGKTNGAFIYNGLDRIDNEKGYTLENVVPCCVSCNKAKRQMTQEEFYDLCRRVAANHADSAILLTPRAKKV